MLTKYFLSLFKFTNNKFLVIFNVISYKSSNGKVILNDANILWSKQILQHRKHTIFKNFRAM